MINNTMAQPNKRKRMAEDIGRPLDETKIAATQEDEFPDLLHIGVENQRTAQAALAEQYPEPTYDAGGIPEFDASPPPTMLGPNQNSYTSGPPPTGSLTGTSQEKTKLATGSEEWHTQRKASHKEGMSLCLSPLILHVSLIDITVERRRREVINDGIESIAKIIPPAIGGNAEARNKGAILHRAIEYINQLQSAEARIDDDRQVAKVAIEELTKRNEALQASSRQAWNESNKWQERCRALGGNYDDYDQPTSFDDGADLEALQN